MVQKISNVALNVRQRMHDLGISSYIELEDKAGAPRDSVRNLMSGRTTKPRSKTLHLIAKALGTSMDELIGPVPSTHTHGTTSYPDPDETVVIPRYDIQLSAGDGAFPNGEQVIGHVPFNRDWLKSNINGALDNLAVVKIDGDSMEPLIRSGDEVLINLSNTSISDGGIFAILLNDTLIIKRIFSRHDGLEIRSENTSYPSWTVPKEDLNEIKIVGRAVVRVGRLR